MYLIGERFASIWGLLGHSRWLIHNQVVLWGSSHPPKKQTKLSLQWKSDGGNHVTSSQTLFLCLRREFQVVKALNNLRSHKEVPTVRSWADPEPLKGDHVRTKTVSFCCAAAGTKVLQIVTGLRAKVSQMRSFPPKCRHWRRLLPMWEVGQKAFF